MRATGQSSQSRWRRRLLSFAAWMLVWVAVGWVALATRGPSDTLSRGAPGSPASQPPVVLLIFDALPTATLLTADLDLDGARFPAFAELAEEAVWYREATTVYGFTKWAIPAILSGRVPDRRQKPTLRDHPESLFTLLAGRQRLKINEHITHLYPSSLAAWTATLDGAVVSQPNWRRTVAELPATPTAQLSFDAFVESIEATDTSSLIFMHSGLPHAPFKRYASGQLYAYPEQGYEPSGEGIQGGPWGHDRWAIVQSYERHVLQARFVDRMLGQLMARLKELDLYDRALVVVTADHGVSFLPGIHRRAPTTKNLGQIMPVPLLIKAPFSHVGRIEDLPVESVDILPTIADHLGLELPWSTDGVSLLTGEVRGRQVRYCSGGRTPLRVEGSIRPVLREAVEYLTMLMPREEGAVIGPAPSLIGERFEPADVANHQRWRVIIDGRESYEEGRAEDRPPPQGAVVGYLVGPGPQEPKPMLAVAVNGTIRATTWTYENFIGHETRLWSALLPEGVLEPKGNRIRVAVVEPHGPGYRLQLLPETDGPPDFTGMRLGAQPVWGVGESGFSALESLDGTSFYRWLGDQASLEVPRVEATTIKVALGLLGAKQIELRLTVAGREVLNEVISRRRWSREMRLPAPLVDEPATVELACSIVAAGGRRPRESVDRCAALGGIWLE